MEKNKKQIPDKSKYNDNTHFEKKYWASGAYLCGIDEVGRGSLSGPLVTAAVILKPFKTHELLVDSKILSEKKRVKATEWILSNSWHAFGMADHHEINSLGIYQATQNAMKRALYSLLSQPEAPHPSKVLVDAIPLDISNPFSKTLEIEYFCYGETRSISIAAASIIAKTYRDELLTQLDMIYKNYDFKKSKGYGTKKHITGIITQGPCLMHRKLFIKKINQGNTSEHHEKNQKSLFC